VLHWPSTTLLVHPQPDSCHGVADGGVQESPMHVSPLVFLQRAHSRLSSFLSLGQYVLSSNGCHLPKGRQWSRKSVQLMPRHTSRVSRPDTSGADTTDDPNPEQTVPSRVVD